MTDDVTKSEDSKLEIAHYVELSELELSCIGHIVAQWGALEFEIFVQTLHTFGQQAQVLPKVMNNLKFSGVLKLWKERVVDQCIGEKKETLDKQYSLINYYHDYRNALVHGMWDWDRSFPTKIKTTRIRKAEVILTHFTASDLQDFSLAVARINFNIRFPRGVEDLAELVNKGGYIGRVTTSMFLGQTVEANEK